MFRSLMWSSSGLIQDKIEKDFLSMRSHGGITVNHWFLWLMCNIKMIVVHKIQHSYKDKPMFWSHKINDLNSEEVVWSKIIVFSFDL
jgi:hypothetical protein